MKKARREIRLLVWVLLGGFALIPTIYAENAVMGEIQFEGKSHVEKTSGVWVDGQYVGYLKELKGSKKVLLLPGEHIVTVRQDGYQDFTERVQVEPGQKQVVRVAMEKALTGPLPRVARFVPLEQERSPRRNPGGNRQSGFVSHRKWGPCRGSYLRAALRTARRS